MVLPPKQVNVTVAPQPQVEIEDIEEGEDI